ncbi:MAG: argininosuccinate synthase [Bacillota bacterium]|nr:argininosuccinate synthase [Bacillota bacterium]
MPKVVLAYSGGLDTSVAVKWLEEKYGYEVITLTVDVGQGSDVEAIRRRALNVGAVAAYAVDAREEFLREFAFRALKANAVYEGEYTLASALSRPLITKLLVEIAERVGAGAIAHGCTGKGNDQVRFDVSAAALAPHLKVVAPVREWPMSRDDEMDYAAERGIPVPTAKKTPYSIDSNLWGRSIECGVLEDPWAEPPEEIYVMTRSVGDCPSEPAYVEIGFEQGVPVSLDGKALDPVTLVGDLNRIAGEHGVGRVDHVENRLVGIKSREIYEAPAAVTLLAAHRDLEDLTLPREVAHFKRTLEDKYAELLYYGLWYSPLREAMDAFIDKTQENVTGTIRVKLHRGQAVVVGRKSPFSLYDFALATYDREDAFNHAAAVGFIEVWGLPTRIAARMARSKAESTKAQPCRAQTAASGLEATGHPAGAGAGGQESA